MKSLRLPLLFIAFLAISSLGLHAAELATAKVLSVSGTVTKYNSDDKSSPLAKGEILKAGDSISAAAMSKAKLVFSNGSIIDVKENTSITIAEFTQSAFGGSNTYEQLQADPSKSQVLLELNYGELDGHVKKLQQGSKFDVETPIGTAAIRGTKFTVKLHYNAIRGEFILKVYNKDGKVNVISRYVGKFEYKGGTGSKGYDSNAAEPTSEPIPQKHTIIVRLSSDDPYFDTLFNLLRNFFPTQDGPDGTGDPLEKVFTPEDPGTQIVSPDTPAVIVD